MKTKKSKFRKIISAVLLLALLFNISVPAYAELSSAKSSEQLKSIFGDDFKICSGDNSKTISFADYFKLIHGFADSEKATNNGFKAILSAQEFFAPAKSIFTSNYIANPKSFISQLSLRSQASRAPPAKYI